MSVESEEFEAWLAHPITKTVMEKAAKIENGLKAEWFRLSWGMKPGDMHKLPTETLAYLKGKADAFASFARIEYKNFFKESENDDTDDR